MAPRKPSEEELGRKWDRCLVDTTFKTVGGAVFGGVLSLLFFKRSAWPVTLGIGIGLGAGYSNCRHQLYWHGPHGPPFGRPPWGRPFWGRPGEGGERGSPFKPSKAENSTPVEPAESQEPKHEDKPSETSRSSSVVNPNLNNLVSAVTFGKGLKPAKVTKGRGSKSDKAQSGWLNDKSTNKAPSSVKADTKAATSVHPYAMPNRPNSRTGP